MAAVPEPDADPAAGPARTARGERTRAALVAAAATVFARDGYLDARIADVAREAGVATGSFYTWFPDKRAIFSAVVADIQEEALHPRLPSGDGDDPVASIAAANRAYLRAYRRHAAVMALREQVALVDEEFRRERLERSVGVVRRNARAVRRLQASGLADPALDPDHAALALSGMVSRLAHDAFVVGVLDVDDEAALDALAGTATRLWTNALGLTGGRSSPASPSDRDPDHQESP